MSPTDTLEDRVDHLEEEVRALQQKFQVLKHPMDWRKTVSTFADDPDFQDLVRAGAAERQAERSAVNESC